MAIENIILLIVAVSQVIFGVFVLFKGRSKTANRLFFIFTVGVALWNVSILFIESGWARNNQSIYLWDRLSYISVPIMVMSMLFYVRHLYKGSLLVDMRNNPIIWILVIFSLIILALVPTDYISANHSSRAIVLGDLYWLLGVYLLFSVSYVIYNLIKGIRLENSELASDFYKILYGFSLTALGGITFNMILPLLGYSSYPALGAASSFFMVLLVGMGAIGSYLLGSVLVTFVVMMLFLLVIAGVFAFFLFMS